MKRSLRDFGLALMTAFGLSASTQAAQTPESGAAPSLPAAKELSGLLAAPNDLATKHDEERRALDAALNDAPEGLDQAVAHLAWANWLLATPTARPATRWILGLAEPGDLEQLARSADDATRHLSEAEKILKTKSDAASASSEKARVRRLSVNLRVLRAFSGVFAAANADLAGEARESMWSGLALGLSDARESEQAMVTSAATLWQAVAWEKAGRLPRAMATLPEALARPEQPFDFAARLLRCRLLSDSGQNGGAMALTTRMGVLCPNWFPRLPQAEIAARRRLIGLLQLKIGEVWGRQLKSSSRPADADLVPDLLVSVRKELFGSNEKRPVVFVLESAVPILVRVPAPSDVKKAPPADEPTKAPTASAPAEEESEDRQPSPDATQPE